MEQLHQEQIVTPPPPEKQNPFDLHAELANIGKFSEEEKAETTPEERMAAKRTRLEEFKRHLAAQKDDLGSLNAMLENRILEEGDFEGAENEIRRRETSGILSPEGAAKYGAVLSEAEKASRVVTDFYREHGARPPEDIYKTLFGKRPFEKVDIIFNPLSVEVACYDPRDFGYISGHYLGKKDSSERYATHAKGSGGLTNFSTLLPELSKCVMASNRQIKRMPILREHEFMKRNMLPTELYRKA